MRDVFDYTEISLTGYIKWTISNDKPNKMEVKLINEYLRSKGFLGYVIKKQNRYIILSSRKEPLKMYLDIKSMLNYLQLKANTIDINFNRYKAKALRLKEKTV